MSRPGRGRTAARDVAARRASDDPGGESEVARRSAGSVRWIAGSDAEYVG